MNPLAVSVMFLLLTATCLHPAVSLGLRFCHSYIAWLRHRLPSVPLSDPPAGYHWIRERLRWLTPVFALPWIASTSVVDASMGDDPGWHWQRWAALGLALTAWWCVQRWQDNRDCTCKDDRHRRRSEAKSKVEARAGKLVIVPT